jgi:hypothetical protein
VYGYVADEKPRDLSVSAGRRHRMTTEHESRAGCCESVRVFGGLWMGRGGARESPSSATSAPAPMLESSLGKRIGVSFLGRGASFSERPRFC